MTQRSARDFVRDLCRSGRSDLEVLAISRVTHWNGSREEVLSWLNRRGERWRKVGKNPSNPPEKDSTSTSSADKVQEPSIGEAKLRLRRTS